MTIIRKQEYGRQRPGGQLPPGLCRTDTAWPCPRLVLERQPHLQTVPRSPVHHDPALARGGARGLAEGFLRLGREQLETPVSAHRCLW